MKRLFLPPILIIISFTTLFAEGGDGIKTTYTRVEEHIASLQISSDQLAKMSTEELLQSCMDFPYLIDFIFYGGDCFGFERMTKEYNGFAELFSRDNFAHIILNEYQKLSNQIPKVLNENDTIKGALSFKCLIYEYMMAKEEFTEKMRACKDAVDGESIILNSFEVFAKYPELFSGVHVIPMKKLLNNGFFEEKNKKKMTRMLSYYIDWAPAVVYTPNGTPLENAKNFVGIDYNAVEQANVIAQTVNMHSVSPDSIVGLPTFTYNCHSYAWHMSQGGGIVWINGRDEIGPHPENGYYLTPYWNDGSYYECTQSDDYDLVLYAGDHSARYLGNGVYESKWGAGPIVRHQLNGRSF